jgi:hypothetical protein
VIHFDCAKILIDDEPFGVEVENATMPVQRVRVITVNGQLWSRVFPAFGLNESIVRAEWEKRELNKWEQQAA